MLATFRSKGKTLTAERVFSTNDATVYHGKQTKCLSQPARHVVKRAFPNSTAAVPNDKAYRVFLTQTAAQKVVLIEAVFETMVWKCSLERPPFDLKCTCALLFKIRTICPRRCVFQM
ncbi:hypothetical protein NDU88_001579 [Pleurodeles waltl]|uniref:Uncharacterized protein n=1 Tax=Pleurodeles waltl TaxID=8319 RepID=A0AAV7VZV5_PLEWA|nr:hypothetical protein NDU88_001579 [Pleurodeles waltl]